MRRAFVWAIAAVLGWRGVLLPAEDRRATAASPERGCPPDLLAEKPIETAGGPIILDVCLEQTRGDAPSDRTEPSYRMLLDTGADRSCFDVRHRAMLGEAKRNLETVTASGPASIKAYEPPVMYVGNLRIQPSGEVACIDLKLLSNAVGDTVDGILGMDALRELTFSVDFAEGQLRFHRGANPDFGRLVPLALKGESGAERPFVKVAFGREIEQEFLIDTAALGNFSGTLTDEVFDRLLERGHLRRTTYMDARGTRAFVATRTGVQDVSLARAVSLTLAGATHKELLFAPHPRVSVLSLAFLSRYSVLFDFPNSAMYLRPGKRLTRLDVNYDLTSLLVSKCDGGAMVEGVREGAWGARAGILQRDLIVAINSRELKDQSLFAIRRMLATEPRQVLTVRRGGAEQRIVLDMTAEIERLAGDHEKQWSQERDAPSKSDRKQFGRPATTSAKTAPSAPADQLRRANR